MYSLAGVQMSASGNSTMAKYMKYIVEMYAAALEILFVANESSFFRTASRKTISIVNFYGRRTADETPLNIDQQKQTTSLQGFKIMHLSVEPSTGKSDIDSFFKYKYTGSILSQRTLNRFKL
jgi:hypothetical protein